MDDRWSTFEQTYIHAFGPRLHEVVSAEFEQRGAHRRDRDRHRFWRGPLRRRQHPRLRSPDRIPPYVSAVRYEWLPSDDHGSSKPRQRPRQVADHPDNYAPGDAGDFPVKQAFLAFLQADTVAEHIAASAGMHGFEKPFDPVSMCIRCLTKATFAQVPPELTGDLGRPVTVRADADGDCKVGTGATWRLGKKMLGMTVPMRFHAGEPFHAGRRRLLARRSCERQMFVSPRARWGHGEHTSPQGAVMDGSNETSPNSVGAAQALEPLHRLGGSVAPARRGPWQPSADLRWSRRSRRKRLALIVERNP